MESKLEPTFSCWSGRAYALYLGVLEHPHWRFGPINPNIDLVQIVQPHRTRVPEFSPEQINRLRLVLHGGSPEADAT